ncbi:MAG: AMP-binding protein [Candidatus Eisenbacteria bacterium]
MHAASIVTDGDTSRCPLLPVGQPESVGNLLVRNAARLGDHPVLLEKRDGRYHAISWNELQRDVLACASFLRGCGVGPGDRVALVSRNRYEALVVEFSVMGLGAIHVPIFVGYAAAQTNDLLRHAEPVVLFVAGPEQLAKVDPPASVRRVVTFDRTAPDRVTPDRVTFDRTATDQKAASNTGTNEAATRPVWFGAFGAGSQEEARSTTPVTLETPASAGTPATPFTPETSATPVAPVAPARPVTLEELAAVRPETPALMMYTSGTSGEQKGVLLTHDNILSQQRALAAIWKFGPDDRILTYLPWHHSFGGIFEKYTALYNGAPLAIDDSFGKDLPVLLDNWKTIRPTVYFSVPLIHQQLVDHVRSHPADETEIYHRGFRFVFTAAAPLPANISEFFAARGIPVVEAWGLTETAPCCTITDLEERRRIPGMVGYPIPGVTVRIAPDAEVLVQGPNVMKSYFRNDEATARALPGDGWFHTGDLGELLPNGGLRLLARKDRVFKLLNAEKVIPTTIENELAGRNKYIRHVLVVGQAQQFLAALIFPNRALIEEEFGADREAADRVVTASYRSTVDQLNREMQVKYERVLAFAVVDRELSVENQELTPSLKIRVQNVLDSTRSFFEAIYDPLRDCDCEFLSRVTRLVPDRRTCPLGSGRTLDHCSQCRSRRTV